MSKKKMAVNVFLSCLCGFVFASALNAASDNSGNQAISPNCTTVGEIQERYTADSGCGYTISERTCCKNKLWSHWGEACPPDPGPTLKVKRSVSDWRSGTCSGLKRCAYFDPKKGYYVNSVDIMPDIQQPTYPKCSVRVDNNFCNDKEEGYTCYESINRPTWNDEGSYWNNNNNGTFCTYDYKYACNIPCPFDALQGGQGSGEDPRGGPVQQCERQLWKGTMDVKFNLVTCVVNNA